MRKHLRHPYNTMALMRLTAGSMVVSAEYVCTIVDISEGGVRFNADFRFDIGATFILLQPKCGHNGTFEVYGEIVWGVELERRLHQYGARLYSRDGSASEELRMEVRRIRDYNFRSLSQFV